MLYPVGKDSSVMLHLACKAFFPAPPPFPFLHIAIGWDFRALLDHRDRMAAEYGLELLVHGNDMAAPGVVASLQYALGAGRHDARVPALELHQARHLDLHPGRGDPVRAALSRGRSADRVWPTGLPGAGKSTIANIVERKLVALCRQRDPKGLCAKADSARWHTSLARSGLRGARASGPRAAHNRTGSRGGGRSCDRTGVRTILAGGEPEKETAHLAMRRSCVVPIGRSERIRTSGP
jgi:hypothetical protein